MSPRMANWKEAVLRNPKSRHDGQDDRRPEIDPEGSTEDGIRRRIVLGSALKAIAIGGLAAGGIVGCASRPWRWPPGSREKWAGCRENGSVRHPSQAS